MMLKSIGIAATAVLGVLATVQPSSAQATACALSGEYVLTASGVARVSPSQLAGSFVFSPPATGAPGIGGKVSIDVAWLSPTGESQTFHSTFAYSVEGLVLNIEGGLAVGDLSGMTDGLATSVALVAGPAQASLVWRSPGRLSDDRCRWSLVERPGRRPPRARRAAQVRPVASAAARS